MIYFMFRIDHAEDDESISIDFIISSVHNYNEMETEHHHSSDEESNPFQEKSLEDNDILGDLQKYSHFTHYNLMSL